MECFSPRNGVVILKFIGMNAQYVDNRFSPRNGVVILKYKYERHLRCT